jgi:hypothetical protein
MKKILNAIADFLYEYGEYRARRFVQRKYNWY